MKVKVIKAFRDKDTKSILKPGQEIDVTEKRFGELTGPKGVFVEEIKEESSANNEPTEPPKEEELSVGTKEDAPPEPNFEKMTKAEIVEYAKELGIELNMEMTKVEMIEILLKK